MSSMGVEAGRGRQLSQEGGGRVVIHAVGLGLVWAWIYCVSVTPSIATGGVGIDPTSVEWLTSSLVNVVALFVCGYLFRSRPSGRVSVVLAGVIPALGTVTISLSEDIGWLLALGGLACGLGYAMLCVLWGVALSRLEIEQAEIAAPGACVVWMACALVFPSITGAAGVVGTSLMPLLSAVLLHATAKAAGRPGATGALQADEAAPTAAGVFRPGSFIRLCLALCATYVVIGLLDVVNDCTPLVVGPANVDLLNFLGSGFGVAMAAAFVAFNVRVDAGRLYRWLVPVLMLGLAFCARGGSGGSALSTVICTGADVCVQAMAILCVFAIHRDEGLSVALGIGCAQGFIQLGVLVGNALGAGAFNLVVGAGGLEAQAALVLGCVLCCFAALVPQTGRRRADEQPDPSVAIEAVAARYRLTQRETEVLDLLAQGRTQPYIRDVLQLSKGTVATHAAHIYAKLGVHSKQELIDLVEAEKGAE